MSTGPRQRVEADSTPLPIDPLLPDVVGAVRSSGALVLVAEPGAGKTTRVPPALLGGGAAGDGEILVVEPRRLAARMAARRVASEMAEPLGERVGYQVRFENKTGPRTRLRFVTEGVLARRLLSDRGLAGVTAVVLDEFHERRLDVDLALAMIRTLRQGERPDLSVVVMSATLEADPVADFLGCEVLRAPGRPFDVTVEHDSRPDERRLSAKVRSALVRLLGSGVDGDVLIFLPGAAEIRRAREACEDLAAREGLDLVVLHGDLPPGEQDRAVTRGARRKVILSTNVAETSVTIEGVEVVIDSGLARVPVHSPWSGLDRLATVPISRASAEQRAGRAGRTGPGRCLRLYTRGDLEGRPLHTLPEIARGDLAGAALSLRAGGWGPPSEFPYFEAPKKAALEAAEELLCRLGAIDEAGTLTHLGRRMAKLPLHPRLARLCIEARDRGVGRRGALLAALLGERDIRLSRRTGLSGGEGDVDEEGPSDLLARIEAFEGAEREGLRASTLRAHGLDMGATRAVSRSRDQLARILGAGEGGDDDEALGLATLAAFGDRVARRRRPRGEELVLSGGGSARLSPRSVVKGAELVVAVEADELRRGRAVVTTASAIEPEWLVELFAERIREERSLAFDGATGHVDEVATVSYDGLVLERVTRHPEPGDPEAARVLAEAANAAGPAAFCDLEELESLRRRVAFASEHHAGIAPIDDEGIAEALGALCEGKSSFAELRRASLVRALVAGLGEHGKALERLAPTHVAIPGRRRAPVVYELDRPPHLSSRLQDFFGASEGPTVAGGAVPLVLHLLAPNGRDVQVTTDLAGFWQRHYPQIRRELMRRYPRHAWPEDPLSARPSRPGRRKRR